MGFAYGAPLTSKYFLTENFKNDIQRRTIRKIRFIRRGDIYEKDFEKNFKENFKKTSKKTLEKGYKEGIKKTCQKVYKKTFSETT
jgi:hypothetical protein